MIELTTFRPAAGTSEAELLEADRLVQTRFAPHQRGFLRRTTARAADGGWLVVVLWASQDEAEAAAGRAATDAHACAFVALADPATLEVRRYTELD
ncbi:MAG: hypothetical protein AVDCRST_MAG20-1568 [uncultured Acidimicrobiales bacterium]|uniref:ABM domain-containing protein n=1 Tax=uncultured Acidimicrobiales bacterium TaxID=310071 RepID=A0A6J4I1V0_9ACTN|nr:MAG: hypothetical protein AVDCRST_MAG20-1568 [uncultured Acidimicrobiales bacterium]